jgi:xanthine dehydrogenase accessory factor
LMNYFSRINDLIASSQSFCLATIIHTTDHEIIPGHKIFVFEDGSFEGGIKNKSINKAICDQAVKALRDDKKQLIEVKPGTIVYFDIIAKTIKLLICGAGHIAIPLSQFTQKLGFSVTVIDDRPEFASKERFKDCEVIAGNFISVINRLPIDSSTYVVIITRGHEHDVECLTEILPKKTAYVGLIGSKRRIRFVLKILFDKGIPAERLQDVFSPIGLPIGADSPEEIALSIASELISVRRLGNEPTRKMRNATKKKEKVNE